MVEAGMRVILACRNATKAKSARRDILASTGAAREMVVVRHLELASFSSVHGFAEGVLRSEEHIDVLVNNAGVGWVANDTRTEDGYELQFQTNHLSHFLLTNLLLPKLIKSRPSRVVHVSSAMHELASMDLKRLNEWKFAMYADTKLQNLLFSNELQRRLDRAGYGDVQSVAVHPGAVASEFTRHWPHWLRGLYASVSRGEREGAMSTAFACVTREVVGGKYVADSRMAPQSPLALDADVAAQLWTITARLTGVGDKETWRRRTGSTTRG